MKDDPRETDWAEKKIKRLERRLHELGAAVFGEDWEGDEELEEGSLISFIYGLERRVLEDRENAARSVVRLDRRMSELDEMIAQLGDRIQENAAQGATPSRRVDRLERRLTHGTGDMVEPLEVWTDRQLSKLAGGVTEMERRMDRFAATIDEMGNHLRRRVDGLDQADARKGDLITENAKAIDEVSEEVGVTDMALKFHNGRLEALEAQVAAGMTRSVPMAEARVKSFLDRRDDNEAKHGVSVGRRMSEPDDGPSFRDETPPLVPKTYNEGFQDGIREAARRVAGSVDKVRLSPPRRRALIDVIEGRS